ncbi:hypothetical protein QCA50_014214 [Cerrena zonata]|uniref:Uncharacterized protein n=1 Tax=Cerrena zonata TaxID=2478898 RepID=A0AAW0FNH0_9APHY
MALSNVSLAGLVWEFTFSFGIDHMDEEDDSEAHLSTALRHMSNVRKIVLECPYYRGVWIGLFSAPNLKDHLKILELHHDTDLDCTDGTPLFNHQAKFPSLDNLVIDINFGLEYDHEQLIKSLFINHAGQLKYISITDMIYEDESETLFPQNITFPHLLDISALPAAQFGRHLSDRMPGLRVLKLSRLFDDRPETANEELSGHFENLRDIDANFFILQLLLSSLRPLRRIRIKEDQKSNWKDFRDTMGMLSNCSQSLLTLELNLHLLPTQFGEVLEEAWSFIPSLPHLKTFSMFAPTKWYRYPQTPFNALAVIPKALFSKLPQLEKFTFQENKTHNYNDSNMQRDILTHWMQEEIPPSLHEIVFKSDSDSTTTWKRAGNSWEEDRG